MLCWKSYKKVSIWCNKYDRLYFSSSKIIWYKIYEYFPMHIIDIDNAFALNLMFVCYKSWTKCSSELFWSLVVRRPLLSICLLTSYILCPLQAKFGEWVYRNNLFVRPSGRNSCPVYIFSMDKNWKFFLHAKIANDFRVCHVLSLRSSGQGHDYLEFHNIFRLLYLKFFK